MITPQGCISCKVFLQTFHDLWAVHSSGSRVMRDCHVTDHCSLSARVGQTAFISFYGDLTLGCISPNFSVLPSGKTTCLMGKCFWDVKMVQTTSIIMVSMMRMKLCTSPGDERVGCCFLSILLWNGKVGECKIIIKQFELRNGFEWYHPTGKVRSCAHVLGLYH